MRRPLPVQVEPLSPQRWARIERGLFAKLEASEERESSPAGWDEARNRRRWVPWAAVSAALFVLGLGFAAWWAQSDSASEARTSRITTGRDGSHLALPGLTLDVDPESTVVVGDVSEGGVLVVVDRGSVVCDVAPRPAHAPLVVQAGAVQVRVVGTRFKVQRRGETARVSVEHGVVVVATGGRQVRVAAGEEWPPAAPPSVGSGESRSSEDAPDSDTAPLAPPRVPQRRAPAVDSSSGEAPRARFERAAALERTSPEVAVSLYRGLERGSDSWAANALFAHGRLELALGRRAEGRRLLERYLTRFPRGPNSDDARSLLQRTR